jgi:DNA-binding SARP family transcriptional activator
MHFRILGPLEVSDQDRELALGGLKQRSLLALLLLHANEIVATHRLIAELWGEAPPATASKSIQVYVMRLRRELGAERLTTRAPGYVLHVKPEELDVAVFERMRVEARRSEPARAAEKLRAALGLWRGPPLADLAYESFAQAEIGRLDELRLAIVEERVDADLACGRHADVVGELEALIAANPLRERLRAQLMLALYRSGRQAEALEAYRAVRRELADELGLEPGEQLRRLESGRCWSSRAPPRRSTRCSRWRRHSPAAGCRAS